MLELRGARADETARHARTAVGFAAGEERA
jgi:hypothetical protein